MQIIQLDAKLRAYSRAPFYNDFVRELAHLPMSQAHALVDFAVKNEIIDNMKVKYLKEVTGRDVVQIIARKRQSEEVDRRQAAIDAAHRAENEGRRFESFN